MYSRKLIHIYKWVVSKNTYIFSHIRANHGVILSGWGSTKIDGKTSAKLKHTQMIIENQTLCYNKYDTEIFDYILQLEPVLPDLIQPSLICATSVVCIYN